MALLPLIYPDRSDIHLLHGRGNFSNQACVNLELLTFKVEHF